MLKIAGFSSIEDMWKKAGVAFPYPDLATIPEGRSEYEVMKHLSSLASKKCNGSDQLRRRRLL
jgi:hypothetical protein